MSDGRNRVEGEKAENSAGRSQRVRRSPLGAALFDSLESRLLLSTTAHAAALLRPAQNVANHAPTEAASGLLSFGATQVTPLTITYQDVLTASRANDVDVETLSFIITNVPSGAGTLAMTHNGTTSTVVAGASTLVPGDTLTWTPSAAVKGNVNAFTVQAEDPELNLAATLSQILVTTTALPQVSVTATSAVIWESKAGTTSHQGTIVLKRTGNLSQPLQVTLSLGGTAVLGTNYTVTYKSGGITQTIAASPAAITFPATVGSITLTLDAVEDNIADPTLTAQVTVTPDPNSAAPAYVPNPAAATASATIVDSNPTFTITAETTGVQEGASNQKAFIITRTAPPGGTLNTTSVVDLNFTGGTFNAAVQLTGASINGGANGLDVNQTLLVTFSPGQTQKVITLTTTDDGLADGTQTIKGNVIAAPGSTLAAPVSATVNVNDASASVSIVSVNASANEATPNTAPGAFFIKRTGPITSALTVNLTNSTGSGFGVLGTSFRLVAGGKAVTNAVTIPAHARSIEVFVIPIDDHANDAQKVTLTLAANGTLYDIGTTKSMTVTITNNDRLPIDSVPRVIRLSARNSSFSLTYSQLVTLMGAKLAHGETHGVLQLGVSAITIGTLEIRAKGSATATAASTSTVFNPGDTLIWNSSASAENFLTAFTLDAVDGTGTSSGTTNFVVDVT